MQWMHRFIYGIDLSRYIPTSHSSPRCSKGLLILVKDDQVVTCRSVEFPFEYWFYWNSFAGGDIHHDDILKPLVVPRVLSRWPEFIPFFPFFFFFIQSDRWVKYYADWVFSWMVWQDLLIKRNGPNGHLCSCFLAQAKLSTTPYWWIRLTSGTLAVVYSWTVCTRPHQ